MSHFLDTFTAQLDDLLQRISGKIQLSQTKHELAESHYQAVGKWLCGAKQGVLKDFPPSIYPQGSLNLGTTTAPMRTKEYDLDFVSEFPIYSEVLAPSLLLDVLFNRLHENEIYRGITKRGKRCITLIYEHDFHMDILPARPATGSHDGNIWIPRKHDLQNWDISNPRGFAKHFDSAAMSFVDVYKLREADMADLPDYEELEQKPPLKLAVQLMKRRRDIAFPKKEDCELAPTSIVLTTLAAHHYRGELSVASSIRNILAEIEASLPLVGRLKVPNPSNPREDFGDRWDEKPKAYVAFTAWLKDFRQEWELVWELKGPALHKLFMDLFGETITVEAIKDQTQLMENARKQDRLGISKAGALTILGSSTSGSGGMRPNTFYGD